MIERLKSLDPGDRRALAIGAVALLSVLVWLLLVAPLRAAADAAESRHIAALGVHERMLAVRQNVQRLGGVPATASDPLPVHVRKALASAGLAGGFAVTPDGLDGVRVRAEEVGYETLMNALEVLTAQRVDIRSLTIKPSVQGETLSAEFTVSSL